MGGSKVLRRHPSVIFLGIFISLVQVRPAHLVSVRIDGGMGKMAALNAEPRRGEAYGFSRVES